MKIAYDNTKNKKKHVYGAEKKSHENILVDASVTIRRLAEPQRIVLGRLIQRDSLPFSKERHYRRVVF